MTKQARSRVLKWLEHLALETKNLDACRRALEQRGVSERTIKDQLRRLEQSGLITGSAATPVQEQRPFLPVPKPSAKSGRKKAS